MQSNPIKHKQTQANPIKHNQTQANTSKHKQTQANPSKHKYDTYSGTVKVLAWLVLAPCALVQSLVTGTIPGIW